MQLIASGQSSPRSQHHCLSWAVQFPSKAASRSHAKVTVVDVVVVVVVLAHPTDTSPQQMSFGLVALDVMSCSVNDGHIAFSNHRPQQIFFL
jgi:hypothetical protein